MLFVCLFALWLDRAGFFKRYVIMRQERFIIVLEILRLGSIQLGKGLQIILKSYTLQEMKLLKVKRLLQESRSTTFVVRWHTTQNSNF